MIRVFNETFDTFTNIAGGFGSASNGTVDVTALYHTLTADGSGSNAGMYGTHPTTVIGRKYYVRIMAKVTNAVCQSIRLNYGGVAYTYVTNPTENTVYDLSTVITATSTATAAYLYQYYADAATANGKVFILEKFLVIDLTEKYGAGSEPTAATMDKIKPLWSLDDRYDGSNTSKTICVNDFETNGEKVIEPKKCIEILEDNVDWRVEITAELTYQPYLLQDYIIVVPTKENGEQPFRISNVKVDNYEVSFTARHIGYDLENYIDNMVFGYKWISGIAYLVANSLGRSIPACPFYSTTSNWSYGKWITYKGVTTLENIYEIQKISGGHITFDWWKINIDQTVGTDHGVTIEYGKNLEGAEIAEDWNSVCTQIYPIGNNKLTLGTTTNMIDATGVSYDRPYTRKVFFQTDDVVELDELADAYLELNKVPKINYKVEADTVQEVGLGDTIKVYSKQFTISTNVLGYKYNVLSQRIEYVEFGNFRRDLKTAFGSIYADIDELKKSVVQENITMNDSLGLSILAYKSTATTCNGSGTNGGLTKFVLDTSQHNTNTSLFEITGGSVKVLKAGVYMITAMTSITSGTAGERINANIAINGGTAKNLVSIGQVASLACRANGTIVLELSANDTVDLIIFNSYTGTKTSAAGVDYNFLAITKQ